MKESSDSEISARACRRKPDLFGHIHSLAFTSPSNKARFHPVHSNANLSLHFHH